MLSGADLTKVFDAASAFVILKEFHSRLVTINITLVSMRYNSKQHYTLARQKFSGWHLC
jgi:hypothetical protein